MLNVIMLSVANKQLMLSVANKPFMLSLYAECRGGSTMIEHECYIVIMTFVQINYVVMPFVPIHFAQMAFVQLSLVL